MGNAKRRKQLDPSYGKENPIEIKTAIERLSEMISNFSESNSLNIALLINETKGYWMSTIIAVQRSLGIEIAVPKYPCAIFMLIAKRTEVAELFNTTGMSLQELLKGEITIKGTNGKCVTRNFDEPNNY